MACILTVDAVVDIEDADAGRQRPAEERREADDADGRVLPGAGQLDRNILRGIRPDHDHDVPSAHLHRRIPQRTGG